MARLETEIGTDSHIEPHVMTHAELTTGERRTIHAVLLAFAIPVMGHTDLGERVGKYALSMLVVPILVHRLK